MTASGYLRFPHINGDLISFTADDDVWLAPADGGRAWRLTADRANVAGSFIERAGRGAEPVEPGRVVVQASRRSAQGRAAGSVPD